MSLKRKFSDAALPHSKRNNNKSQNDVDGHRRVLGNSAVPSSFPLSNMLDAVRQLIDPDFDPDIDAFVSDTSFSDNDEPPRFLKLLPSRVASEDVDFLRSKGALTIPETPLRNELLRVYVQWVYSSLPVLDLHSFLEAVATNDANANISLLLFQAVMFAGTAFVDIKFLKAAGFETRREARKAFFNNARLLCVLDCEDDRIATIQSILLMTYYYEKDESLQNDIWHWVGVCYTHAQSIGLHRDPTKSNMSPEAKRLRIRLWWCLYLRDRLVALALHRPTQINEGICNVAFLGLAEFDIKPFHAAVNNILVDCSFMGDAHLQRRLSVMFIEKVKLCQCLGRVLFAQYAPFNCLSETTQETTITLVPRQASDAELQRCSQKLDAWLNNLPDEATFIVPREKKKLSNGDDVLCLHSSMLQMVYHATCTALYRPRASSSTITSTPEISETLTTVARKKIRDAASETADTAYRLRDLGLTPYMPTYGLTVLTPAAVVHMINLKSTNPAVRDKSTWDFRLCIEVISEMRDIYPAADYESACLEMAIQQLQQGKQTLPTIHPVITRKDNVPMRNNNPLQGGTSCMPATDLNISIIEQRQQHVPILGESQIWDWTGNYPNRDQDKGKVDCDRDESRTIVDLKDDPFHSTQPNTRTGHEGITPHKLMIYNDDYYDTDDDLFGFQTSGQRRSPLPSFMDEGAIITGDLERDLGFI